MQYDAAGSLVFDNYTGTGSRAYDAEGRIVSAQDSGGGAVAYTYDADGRRIKRTAYNASVWQLHGPGGELLAEYDAGAAPFAPTKEFGYRRGELLVTAASGDPDRVRRFVKNLYYNALARDPSAGELQTQADALAQAGAQGGESQLLTTARSMARGLFQSSEYVARNRTDAEYVTDLYNSYLQRGPDTPGLNYWVSNTQSNGRGATLNAFEVSTEFATLASTIYGTASGGENQRVEAFVRTFYLGALQRDPTSAELQAQTQRLNNAGAVNQSQAVSEARAMGAEIFQSTNYNSSRTNQQYVTDLYVAFLQRQPDGPGLNYWANNVAVNGRPATLEAFKVSTEYTALAGTLYREVFWLVTDQIGTPRMAVARTGSLAGIRRHDYLPFGEELYAGVGWRGTAQGYGLSDNVRQKFTAQERDAETGLDYFKARYYASALGRFTGTDPVIMSKDRAFNPQEINLYAYCKNSPLGHTDPDGKFFVGTDGKKVDVSVDKTGNISVGTNASSDLKRMAGLVSKSGSATAMSQFMKVASNDTSVHFKIEGYSSPKGTLLGLHQAHDAKGNALGWDGDERGKFNGEAEFLTKGKKGDAVGYKEATITLYESEIKDDLTGLQQKYGDPRVTVEDALVSVFSHETDHDTDEQAVQAIQDRQEGTPNDANVEDPARAIERQVIDEIIKNRPQPN
jgi:RHS repeat-associated protein